MPIDHPAERRFLILDDEPLMTTLLASLVSRNFGGAVDAFTCPFEAYEALQAKPYSVISMDHQMPGCTGLELLVRLRREPGPNRETPVLIFTGFGEDVRTSGSELDRVLLLDKSLSHERYLHHLLVALSMAGRLPSVSAPKLAL